ncbi:MAG TPA: MFS transporter [Caldilineaceae bacterium]|nr:MFS transporter [Caldilineaceae bacterium]
MISVIFGIFMVALGGTAVNVAFATLQKEFAAAVNATQWIIGVYVLALGISTPLSGFLGDRIGMKRTFLAGLSLFILGSFVCGISPILWVLIAARSLQGAGGGIGLPLGTAFLFATFPHKEQGIALGYFGVALVVAPALGPILGGYLVDILHRIYDWL